MTRRRTFFIAALPATLSYDGSNDLLDPTEGFRLSGRFSPEASLQSGTFFYSRAQIHGSFYPPVSDSLTIAGRTRGSDKDTSELNSQVLPPYAGFSVNKKHRVW